MTGADATDRSPERGIRRAGDRALLVTAPVAEFVAALREHRPPGVRDVLPAAETVLVTLDSVRAGETVRRELEALLGDLDAVAVADVWSGMGEPVRIPVRYDGADLVEVAGLLGMEVAEVVAAHTGVVWRCAFVGFAPGFGYLESPDGRLAVPRRAQARTAIPAGAVALAGGYSAVYPRSSPGGWQLIGHTDAPMWDAGREQPALVRAGAAVRFEAVDR
ncbi:5-oxoprolinase subunit B family protein [Nocardia bovistercoris]|uniref:Allophanate hydrolase subunit 1 n=1 Tax=Nocardia bovistercoris TaxID=2785916 RepID=A0A931N6R1_9NOCA|nr:allophanate hydrolase subunit 1 [Nocardia bovistercoris]MBH0781234.1 allophanate hydrolase subunit 1 [Nocardia bovistercoris]